MSGALFATAGVVLVAGLGFVGMQVWDEFSRPRCEGEGFHEAGTGPDSFVLRISIANGGGPENVRVCLFDGSGHKAYVQPAIIEPGSERIWDVELTSYPHRAVFDVEQGRSVELKDLTGWYEWCKKKQGLLRFEYGPADEYLLHTEEDCGEIGGPARQGFDTWMPAPLAVSPPKPPGPALVALGGVTILGGLIVNRRAELKFFLLGLFSRITGPKVLDQSIRARIHELVGIEPGIRPGEIQDRLDLGAGHLAHHLRVLVRERALTTVGGILARYYFVAGRQSPARMRQLALLRNPRTTKFYDSVTLNPGGLLSGIAQSTGLSRPRASRMAKRLETAGLVRRERRGHFVLLYPVSFSETASARASAAVSPPFN